MGRKEHPMIRWLLTVDEKKYPFNMKMVTAGVLIHIKQWYGTELGRYNNFLEAFQQGDPDAAKCALWIARREAGEKEVPEPKNIDGSFPLILWLDVEDEPVEEGEEDPNPTGDTSPPQTPASTEIPTNSGEITDGSSPPPSAGSSGT
jgi:hypothetical protein